MIMANVDEFPELAALAEGDPISLVVQKISDDGKTYELGPAAEELPPVEPGAGRAAVANTVLGGGGGQGGPV
jgi:hypothetical protein